MSLAKIKIEELKWLAGQGAAVACDAAVSTPGLLIFFGSAARGSPCLILNMGV